MGAFLQSPTGIEMLRTLRESARPSVGATAAHGTHEDVKMQMALNLVASIERNRMVDEIEQLALPSIEKKKREIEPLEAE